MCYLLLNCQVFGIDLNSFCTVLDYCDGSSYYIIFPAYNNHFLGMDLDMYLKVSYLH